MAQPPVAGSGLREGLRPFPEQAFPRQGTTPCRTDQFVDPAPTFITRPSPAPLSLPYPNGNPSLVGVIHGPSAIRWLQSSRLEAEIQGGSHAIGWPTLLLTARGRPATHSTTCKARWCMETQTLHRGRLIDHLQLVVKDLAASQRFTRPHWPSSIFHRRHR